VCSRHGGDGPCGDAQAIGGRATREAQPAPLDPPSPASPAPPEKRSLICGEVEIYYYDEPPDGLPPPSEQADNALPSEVPMEAPKKELQEMPRRPRPLSMGNSWE